MRDPSFELSKLPCEMRCLAAEEIWRHVWIEERYRGYLSRQQRSISTAVETTIPADFDFSRIPGLRNETREKLTNARPDSLGAARHLPGLTAADLAILSVWLGKTS
jgi:tRNA uridine 5-carboxymethylaminomethyl modification enzyme